MLKRLKWKKYLPLVKINPEASTSITYLVKMGGEEFLDVLVRDWVPVNSGKVLAFEKTISRGYFVELRLKVFPTKVVVFIFLRHAETIYPIFKFKIVLLKEGEKVQKNSLYMWASGDSFNNILEIVEVLTTVINKCDLIELYETDNDIVIIKENGDENGISQTND